MEKTCYRCKDNDNAIELIFEDDHLDELWIGAEAEKAYITIGYEDLQHALNRVGYKVEKRK